MKILIVDDDKNFTLTLCQILHLEGYECCEAHSVDEAESILSVENFDLILSDVRMPENSGPELYYRIKSKLPNIPFILMTAYSSNEIIEEALDSGILAALPKPIDIQSILAFLEKLDLGLHAAVICDGGISCHLVNNFLDSKGIRYSEFESISQLLKQDLADFSFIFIDAHHPCEDLKSDICNLRNHLPEKAIIILCALDNLSGCKEEELLHSLNLIILPRDESILIQLDKILDSEYYQIAKKHIGREL